MPTAEVNRPVDRNTADAWRTRLDRAGAEVEATYDAYRAALELRNGLIVEAVDTGHSTVFVAKAARLSQSGVMGVLAKGDAA